MNKKLLGLSAAVLVSAGLSAQEKQNDSIDLQQLDEVVVSDSRFELKRENSGKTVIKIGIEELQRSQGKSVVDIINAKSGIEIAGSRGTNGGILGVFARGGRGRQVLVLIDGVRVSDPSSFSQEYDLRLLSAANIESIEILKGAASTLYGTNAATAVINITTKKVSKRKVALNVQTLRGTNHTSEDQNYNLAQVFNSVQLGGTLDKFTYQVGFSNRYSEGLSAIITPQNHEDSYSQINTDIKLGYQLSHNFKIGIYANQTKLNTEYDESFGLFDADYRFLSDQKRTGLSAEYKYLQGSLHLNTAYTNYDSENKSAFPSAFTGENYVVDIFNKNTFNDKFHTIVGLNFIKDEAAFATTRDFNIIDPYANLVYVSEFGLNLNVGARYNNHSEYGSHLVYNLNPSFTFKTEDGYVKALTSYATSYITPSLTQLFGNFGANPDLEPEENRTLEGGLEYAIDDKFRVSGVYFNRKEENFVFFDNITGTFGNSEGTIDAQGTEVELNWMPSEKIKFTSNYTFTERKGDAAIRIPKHKVNATLGYVFSKRTFASLDYRYIGERLDTDFNTFSNAALDPYSLLNVYVEHELLPKRFKVFIGIQNLLNADYVEIIGYTTKGRNINAGINLNLY
ncbi:MAG: TonB-dependent receptor [Maribacter sp.]|nr:TonB-dependent receptor [Maribacter sp.]